MTTTFALGDQVRANSWGRAVVVDPYSGGGGLTEHITVRTDDGWTVSISPAKVQKLSDLELLAEVSVDTETLALALKEVSP